MCLLLPLEQVQALCDGRDHLDPQPLGALRGSRIIMAQDEHGACVRLGDDVDAVVARVVDEEVALECVGQFTT